MVHVDVVSAMRPRSSESGPQVLDIVILSVSEGIHARIIRVVHEVPHQVPVPAIAAVDPHRTAVVRFGHGRSVVHKIPIRVAAATLECVQETHPVTDLVDAGVTLKAIPLQLPGDKDKGQDQGQSTTTS